MGTWRQDRQVNWLSVVIWLWFWFIITWNQSIADRRKRLAVMSSMWAMTRRGRSWGIYIVRNLHPATSNDDRMTKGSLCAHCIVVNFKVFKLINIYVIPLRIIGFKFMQFSNYATCIATENWQYSASAVIYRPTYWNIYIQNIITFLMLTLVNKKNSHHPQ